MREWFSASELADFCLPDLPATRRGILKRAMAEGWTARDQESSGVGRPGREYHVDNLSPKARAALVLRQRERDAKPARPSAEEPIHPAPSAERTQALWERFEKRPASIREEAQRRFDAAYAVQHLVDEGTAKMAAYEAVASQVGQKVSTIRSWMRLVAGQPRGDWLPLLAPQYTGRTSFAEYEPEIYQLFRDLYLRAERPTYTDCYDRVALIATSRGWTMPSIDTLKRELERAESRTVVVLEREGPRAAAALYPAQERDRSGFYAMEALNMDGHKLDIAAVWPDGEVCRVTAITLQDLYSNTIVGLRLAKAESAYEVRLACLKTFDDHGLPKHLWVDNTLAMASKQMTAGAKNRYRWRDKEGDPEGILKLLGVEPHFTTPAHGQAKPIERAFRDLAESVSKNPALSGAYLGNTPSNKPHNYGARVVTVEEIRAVCEQEILRHNLKEGRNTAVCARRLSYWQAFDESYRKHLGDIPRITESQRRLLYLVADAVTVQGDGTLRLRKLGNNRYHSELLLAFKGRKVMMRYNPDDLHGTVFVYTLAGQFLCEASCIEKSGFADIAAAETHERNRNQFKRRTKKLAEVSRRMKPKEIAAITPLVSPPPHPTEVATGTDGAPVRRGGFGVGLSVEKLPTVGKTSRERGTAARQAFEDLGGLADQLDAHIRQRTRRTE